MGKIHSNYGNHGQQLKIYIIYFKQKKNYKEIKDRQLMVKFL